MIYIGADHRGFALKEALKDYLEELQYDFEDAGALQLDPADDYPDYAYAAAKKVAESPQDHRGILICGSGVGADVAANKVRSIRSALCFNTAQAKASRNDDDANILTLASDFISKELAKEIVKIWLETPFGGAERYVRRIEKIKKIEEENSK